MIQIFSFLRNWNPKSQTLTPQRVNLRGSTAHRALSGEGASSTMPPRQVLHLLPPAMAQQQTLPAPAGAWQCSELKVLPPPGQKPPRQTLILPRGQAAGGSPAQTRLHARLGAPSLPRCCPMCPPLLAWTAASSTSMKPRATAGGIPHQKTRQLPGKLQLWGFGWFPLCSAPLSCACAVALLLSQPGPAAAGGVTTNPQGQGQPCPDSSSNVLLSEVICETPPWQQDFKNGPHPPAYFSHRTTANLVQNILAMIQFSAGETQLPVSLGKKHPLTAPSVQAHFGSQSDADQCVTNSVTLSLRFTAAAVWARLCGRELFNWMGNPAIVIFVLVCLLPNK